MSKIRVGFIGCGSRNRRGHMEVINKLDGIEMAAVCDLAEEIRNATADEYGIKARFSSIDEMLDANILDAVVIATPAHLNAQAAKPCLERGIHTLFVELEPNWKESNSESIRSGEK